MSNQVIPKESRAIFGAAVILSGLLWGSAVTSGHWIVIVLAVLVTLVMGFMLYFFRDPDRSIPQGDNLVSPCDGVVLSIEQGSEEVLGGSGTVISIFMSIFDVHVNRNVCDGKVLEVEHRPGRFGHAGKERASLENEQIRIIVEHSLFKVVVTQVAGMLARRIICRLKVGDRVEKGERFGMIVFGSKLIVAVPDAVKVSVAVGQRVRAGETILGVIDS